jgi:thioredoxin 1
MAKKNVIPELSEKEFDKFTKDGVVLIDFFAEWCMPCMMMSPVVEGLNEKFGGKIKFGKVNVDDNSKSAHKFNVSSIPNFVVFKDGKAVEQFVGSISEEDLEEKLKSFL